MYSEKSDERRQEESSNDQRPPVAEHANGKPLVMLSLLVCALTALGSAQAALLVPMVIGNACSLQRHIFVGMDGSVLLRRVVDNTLALDQFCDVHLLDTATCDQAKSEVDHLLVSAEARDQLQWIAALATNGSNILEVCARVPVFHSPSACRYVDRRRVSVNGSAVQRDLGDGGGPDTSSAHRLVS